MPKKLASFKLKKGEARTLSCRGILSLRWHDKKDVYIIITKHSKAEMVDKRDGKNKKKKASKRPNQVSVKASSALRTSLRINSSNSDKVSITLLYQPLPTIGDPEVILWKVSRVSKKNGE